MKYSLIPIVFCKEKRGKSNTKVLCEMEKLGSDYSQIEKDVKEITAELRKVYVTEV